MPEDVDRWRRQTPGCAEVLHLNNAGAALSPVPVLEAVRRYLELEAHLGGYEAADKEAPALRTTYDAVGRLVGAPAGNIALVDNATVAFGQALSTIPFQPEEVILTTRADYVSNQVMFLSLKNRFGVRVIHAPDQTDEEGYSQGVDPQAFGRLLEEHRPRLAAVTHVPTYSGRIQKVAEIGVLCRELSPETLYLVDACQSVGQMPVDVAALGCDFLSATSRKFLRGPRGMGFLYVSDRVLEDGFTPLLPDLHSVDWVAADEYRPVDSARRFENWEFNHALVLGLGAATRYALEVGLDTICRRNAGLTAHLRQSLEALPGVEVVDRSGTPGEDLAAIVTAVVPWPGEPDDLVRDLRLRDMHTSISLRNSALLEFDDRGISWALRISPHYYNIEGEIDTLVNTLGELLQC